MADQDADQDLSNELDPQAWLKAEPGNQSQDVEEVAEEEDNEDYFEQEYQQQYYVEEPPDENLEFISEELEERTKHGIRWSHDDEILGEYGYLLDLPPPEHMQKQVSIHSESSYESSDGHEEEEDFEDGDHLVQVEEITEEEEEEESPADYHHPANNNTSEFSQISIEQVDYHEIFVQHDHESPPISPDHVGLFTHEFAVVEEELEEHVPPPPPPPPRKKSEDAFRDEYMEYVPDTPTASRRISKEAVDLRSIPSTPSPPSTPKKTLRRMHQCPSVESFLKLGEPVQLEFVVLPGQKIFCATARMDRTIADIKKAISPICKVPYECLDLRRNRNLVMDHKTLREIGAKPRKKMRFTVEISKRCPEAYSLKIPEESSMTQASPAVRRVRVKTSKGPGYKTVKVDVEFPSEPKLFIGGYRDRRSDTYYHNAQTQTPFETKYYSENAQDFSCQTFNDTWKKVQTQVTTYSQTTRPDYYISSLQQRIIYPRVYVSADQIEARRIKAAIVIQKYWRRWLAKRERANRLEGLIKRIEWAESIRRGRTEVRLAIKEDEMWRQNNPSRMVDVELLYRAINEWRRKEIEYVNKHRWGSDRKAALAEIMEKEADLLLDLERTKTKIRKNMHNGYVEKIFHKMGDPTRWLNRSGNFIQLDNKEKHDMRQYHKLYDLLKQPVTEITDRIEALNQLQDITKTYTSRTSNYLSSLIDREFELIKFNAGPRLMEGLRQRVLNAFYYLLRDPNFNPEAKKLQRVPFDKMKLRKDMVQCKSCRKQQYREHFTVVRGVTVTTRCSQCMSLYRTCILRSDLNLYRRMLAEIRHEEQMAGVETSVTYLIDAYDLQFIIEQLWQCQSALSGIDDRYMLRLCRWKRDEPWTPWNCVLLTEEEAVAHLNLDDTESAYQPAFIQKVQIKHQGAKIYFARLSFLAIPLDPNLKDKCDDLEKKNKKLKMLKAREKMLADF